MAHLNTMKKYYLALTFSIVIIFGHCQSNGSVEGIVYDSIENQGIAFVNVYISMVNIGVFTDTNGRFKIQNLKPGEYEISFSLVGYGRPKLRKCNIYQDSTIFIDLTLAECEYDKLGQPSCPICNKTDEAISIFYGEPTKGTLRKAKKGSILIGGSTVSNCDPYWYCKRDKSKF